LSSSVYCERAQIHRTSISTREWLARPLLIRTGFELATAVKLAPPFPTQSAQGARASAGWSCVPGQVQVRLMCRPASFSSSTTRGAHRHRVRRQGFENRGPPGPLRSPHLYVAGSAARWPIAADWWSRRVRAKPRPRAWRSATSRMQRRRRAPSAAGERTRRGARVVGGRGRAPPRAAVPSSATGGTRPAAWPGGTSS
jgi:hypothetical protein